MAADAIRVSHITKRFGSQPPIGLMSGRIVYDGPLLPRSRRGACAGIAAGISGKNPASAKDVESRMEGVVPP
jgi:hypothetical protein